MPKRAKWLELNYFFPVLIYFADFLMMSIIGVNVNDGFTTSVDSVPDKLSDRLVAVTNRTANTYMVIGPCVSKHPSLISKCIKIFE